MASVRTGQSSSRVLVLGLDQGCGKLVRKWVEQGNLPVLGSLISEGTWGWLKTTAETLHVSAWPTIYTGTLPGKHGVYYTHQPAPGLQGHQRFQKDQYGEPTFWKILDDAGVRCAVFDATYTHPEKGFSGAQIFDWGTWAWYWKPMSMPAGLGSRLERACGAYPLDLEAHRVGLGYLDPLELQERLSTAAEAKARAALWLMDEVPWDLFLMVFCEPHPGAHYCWPHAGNGSAPRSTISAGPSGGPSAGPADTLLLKVYQAIDRGIGEILDRVGEEITVFVVSGDGVGPNHSGWHLLPDVLRESGFIAAPGVAAAARGPEESQGESGKTGIAKRVKNLVPADLRKAIANRLPHGVRDAINRRMMFAGVDWSRTRAYCLPTDLEGCIRINVKGREPRGVVAPGEDYERVCTEIETVLKELTNPRTGRPAVREVVRADEVFPGKRRDYLPDLIVLWSDEAEISELESSKIRVSAPSPDARTGTHRAPGFVIAHGPSMPRGQTLEGKHILDVAPTLLAHFAVARPPQMDGTVWSELNRPEEGAG